MGRFDPPCFCKKEIVMRSPEEILADDCLWSVREVAHYLRMSTSWVYNAAERGELPTLRIGGRLRFDPDQIRAFARGDATRAVVSIGSQPRSPQ